MGVFKWLRRERMTVTTRHSVSPARTTPEEQYANSTAQIGTIRTEEYKRDLAEFQARRSIGNKEKETPVKKKCGRHSLPVSCTDCSADHDNTFNYEKKSAVKYKKKQSRAQSNTPEKVYEPVPNIQFLFQNQVFMPGNLYPGSFSEPHKSKRHSRHVCRSPDMEFVQKHIDFREDEQIDPPADFGRNNSLPYEDGLGPRSFEDEVDGPRAACDVKVSSQSSENRDDSCEEKLWEVMSELKHFDQWADEQLQARSPNMSKSDDSKSETSAYGLPVASACNLDLNMDKGSVWKDGRWGVVPVQVKKLDNVTPEHVRKKRNTEINILRKCRHPNIILLMGLYPDAHNNIHIICERCVDSLFGILHVQGRILSAQTSVQYALDVANALVFLRMQGYVHSELSSMSVMVTSHDAAKLCDLGPCVKVAKVKTSRRYDTYTVGPQYVNIEDIPYNERGWKMPSLETRNTVARFFTTVCVHLIILFVVALFYDNSQANAADCEPLLSARSSEAYLRANAVAKHYTAYAACELYRWQAPELFVPDAEGVVYPCSKSDVYSLSLMLWECCNASIPWKNLTYEKLKQQYTLWKGGVSLPQDGTYPGSLLALLQAGLTLERERRMDLDTLQSTLHKVKTDLDDIGYVIIPARLPKTKATFSSSAWEVTSPTDSECLSPQNIEHRAVIHKSRDSSTESSEKECSKSDSSPLYETIRKSYKETTYAIPEKCFLSDDDKVDATQERQSLKYELIPENECSSACSTPIAKIRARMKEISTPGTLHRSDSTEYCSILSPNRTVNFSLHDHNSKDQSGVERPVAKLSRSFTPKSYKPLHIKVPDYNLESIRPLLKDRNSVERSSYNFDIQNYSLPTTPIARSNKLRKNAWLSGDLSASDRVTDKKNGSLFKSDIKLESFKNVHSAPETPATSIYTELQKQTASESNSPTHEKSDETSAESVDTIRDSYTGLKRIDPPIDFLSPETDDTPRERTSSWSYKAPSRAAHKYKIEDDILANLHVKPLVAIHEKWIYEANKKTGRSMSLPEDNRSHAPAVKPASHCVDTFQKSLPQLNLKKPPPKAFRVPPSSPNSCTRNGGPWDHYCQARDTVAKSIKLSPCDTERAQRRDSFTGTMEEKPPTKTDQSTDTRSIEEFIRDLIRKEFQHLLHEISDDTSTTSTKNEDILNKGVANIIETLNTPEEEKTLKKEPTKSFSRVKINGNNKPLLQITFSRSGENSLQVLDNCVNVTICDSNTSGKEKVNVSLEDTLTEDVQVNSLKRCQAFNAIQEARSTEDLYIDDDLSTQMQENFGGKVKLIPLHGSLHEILCEKEDDCCLIKVRQENGCDTIYFRCDNSDTESRDAIDGCDDRPQDTVVFKRSISLIEERIQRVFPKDKRAPTPRVRDSKPETTRARPKSEIFIPIKKESRLMSVSSPSLAMKDDRDEVEVNIENVMCYQDSSSDECLKCQDNDDFELLERKIEEDMANNLASLTCGCLEKISEENLSVLNEELTDKD